MRDASVSTTDCNIDAILRYLLLGPVALDTD